MLSRSAVLLALALAAAPASAEEECQTCWTDACKDLSSYLPKCKPKSHKPKKQPEGPKPVEVQRPIEPPPPRVSVEAATARSTAAAFLKSGKLEEALTFANQAIDLAPEWPEAIVLRAQVYEAQAGPGSDLASLNTPDPNVDYAAMASHLKAAIADYESYLKFAPRAPDRDKIIEALGDLNARVVAAQKDQDAAAQIKQQQATEAQQRAEQQRREAERQAELRRQQEAQQRVEAEHQRQLEIQRQHEAELQRQRDAQARAEAERQAQIDARRRAYEESRDSAESSRHAGYTLATLGGAAGATALLLKSASDNRYDQLQQKQPTGYAAYAIKASADHYRVAAGLTALGGAVLLAAGVPLVLANLPPAEPQFSLQVGPGSLGVLAAMELP
jgi:hypothetical protein